MLAIKVSGVKNFMNGFLVGNLFDPFLMIEGTLVGAITYSFDGHLNLDFYPEEERDRNHHPFEHQPWSEIKSLIYDLIRGSNAPLHMHFMLQLRPDKASEMLIKNAPDQDFSLLKALIVNIKYENGAITITTGTSYSTFVMSHDADNIWDRNLLKYLSGKGIDYEVIS